MATNIHMGKNKQAFEQMLGARSEMMRVCQPLFKYTPIYEFSYARFYSDGSHIYLSTSTSWVNSYYYQQLYEDKWQIFTKCSYVNNEAYLAWKDCRIDRVLAAAYGLGFSNGFIAYRNNPDYKESFEFAIEADSQEINAFYLANVALVRQFIQFFRLELDKSPNLQSLKFFMSAPPPQHNVTSALSFNTSSQTLAFFQATQGKRIIVDDTYVTKREAQCLYWCLQGKTAEETAMILSSSKKTVENHLENIKQRLNCNNKFQLVSKICKADPEVLLSIEATAE